MTDKIKYWWSDDRQFFCIMVNDGTAQATVSLTVGEAEDLMAEVQQTPGFLALQEEAWERAKELLEEHRSPAVSKDSLREAVEYVVDKFKKDEAQGYHTKDREFAITILDKALAVSNGEL